jgi:hypothetical protein
MAPLAVRVRAWVTAQVTVWQIVMQAVCRAVYITLYQAVM